MNDHDKIAGYIIAGSAAVGVFALVVYLLVMLIDPITSPPYVP